MERTIRLLALCWRVPEDDVAEQLMPRLMRRIQLDGRADNDTTACDLVAD